jgi:hypothetical protein
MLEVARTFDAKSSDSLVYSIEGILYFVKLVSKLDLVTKPRYANHIEAMRRQLRTNLHQFSAITLSVMMLAYQQCRHRNIPGGEGCERERVSVRHRSRSCFDGSGMEEVSVELRAVINS